MPNPTAKPRFSARALGMTRPLVLGLALSALAMPPALMAHDGKPHGQKNDPYEELANDGLQIKRGKNTGKGQGITAGYDLKNTHDPGVSKITLGNIQDCKNASEYSQFINKRLPKLQSVISIYLTSWGELFCKTYSGANCMSRCLIDVVPQVYGSAFPNPNFLKLFVPGSRKDADSFQWLESYIIKSLKIRSTKSKN